MAMRVSEFVDRIRELPKLRTLYVKGGWGAPLNDHNKRRVINAYTYNAKRSAKIYAATADTFAFDCCGIVKSVLWGFSADPSKNNGGALYKANSVPDLSEAGFLSVCTKVSKDWTDVPVGACLFMPGHMGVYIGDGLAVESTPIWADGVQTTHVENMGKKGRGNGRTWTQWGLIPYVDYKEDDMTKEEIREIVEETIVKIFPDLMRSYNDSLAKLPASNAETQRRIDRVIDAGLMGGGPSGSFRPQSPMKREELAIVLSNMLPDK